MYVRKAGDWKCSCGEWNFAKRQHCRKCSRANSCSTTVPTSKPGDWKCPSCSCMNFATRSACFKCTRAKPSESSTTTDHQTTSISPGATPAPRPGDWNCKCGEMNFGSRSQCRKCGAAKAAESGGGSFKQGDWKCPRCTEHNFARRTHCYSCGMGKDGSSQGPSTELPPYWDKEATAVLVQETDPDRLSQITSAILATDHCGKAANLSISKVMRIQNSRLWKRFQHHKEEMVENRVSVGMTSVPPIKPAVQAVHPCLDHSDNEFYLFHGTAEATANLIAQNGFDERVANLGGLYGAGIYFAEQFCKSFQYTRKSDDGEHCMLYCRVALGIPYYATGGYSDRRPPVLPGQEKTGALHDSVIANSGKANSGAQVHRELVVFDRAQVYPEFLIHFKP